jgi:hopene-associated glycosyltransferase HpnB
VTLAIAIIAAGAWAYILFLRGGFWRTRERDDLDAPPDPETWPSVVAVVPARNEADVIGASIGSLVAQDYPGPFRILLVDDSSDDGTATFAPTSARLEVLTNTSLPAGWTGKLWAVSRGVEQASRTVAPDYLLLTDADIAHAPDNLRSLVARAESRRLVLTSLMAKLSTDSRADRLMIPAFVFFFAMLYPFAWVNDPRRKIAAAAGGCMLVDRKALERAGGIAAIRHEIIDDCALGRLLKRQGPIWIGLTERARSLRPYGSLGAIGHMVARSAYAQLGYSPAMLVGTVASMVLVYLAAPILAVATHGVTMALGLLAWVAMLIAFQPTLRFYRLSPMWGVAVPLIALLYLAFTIRSAFDVWRGKGGQWKGRAQAAMGGAA